jgi:hypothetical protein
MAAAPEWPAFNNHLEFGSKASEARDELRYGNGRSGVSRNFSHLFRGVVTPHDEFPSGSWPVLADRFG